MRVGLALALLGAIPSAAEMRFVEIAERAGLRFILDNDASEQKRYIETMPGGVAAFDYDGDGLTDVFFTNGAPTASLKKDSPRYFNRLYRNLGGLKFRDVTEEAGLAGEGYSVGAAAADYDNDGDIDLFVAGVNRNILYRNTGRGRFEDVTAQAGIAGGRWAVAAAWLDYDNDGRLDLFVVNYVHWSAAEERFCGDPARNLRVYCHPRYYRELPNALYRNRGDGTFEDVSERAGLAAHLGKGMGVAIADYDDDGWIDVFVTNDYLPNFLFRNTGGAFEEVGLLAGVALRDDGETISNMGADFRDYDNDGRPDISVVALAGQTFPLFRNLGKGAFRDVTYTSGLGKQSVGRSGWSPAFADFDNDGLKDLFVSCSHVNDRVEMFQAYRYLLPNALFRNTGGGRLEDVSEAAGFHAAPPRAHRGAAVADFDDDGRLDIVVTALNGPAELWHNVSETEHSWLRLRLEGRRSNRDGIGARLRIGEQHNQMTTSYGYASSVHQGVHFGLGRLASAVEVEVLWPSGARQRLTNVPVNREARVREP